MNAVVAGVMADRNSAINRFERVVRSDLEKRRPRDSHIAVQRDDFLVLNEHNLSTAAREIRVFSLLDRNI